MRKDVILVFGLIVVFIAISCLDDEQIPIDDQYLYPIEATNQRTGDAERGKEYLIYGDYINSGIPLDIFKATLGLMSPDGNVLDREGENADIPYSFTNITAHNGVEVVSPNCLQCHGEYIDDKFVLGLGNTTYDYTVDQSIPGRLVDNFVLSIYDEDSPEWEAYAPLSRALGATSPYLVTDVVGVNPADKLAAVLAAYRDPFDLSWLDSPQVAIPEEVIPADVPAWWLLKKKNAMFSTGIGRGDFARIMMASSVYTFQDTTEASEIENRFTDVQAFINSIEPPVYPRQVDKDKADLGKTIFEENCAKCHGRYDGNSFYPNLLIDHTLIGTDKLLAESNYAYEYFEDWYNNSWFSKEPHRASLIPGDGYVAPPLDGVWATAPYLHNGSIPTIDALLDSASRPTYWLRTYDSSDYNFADLGWNYSELSRKQDKYTYDTTLPGYGNQGHLFGDHLSDSERDQLIEYLKTL